MCCFVDKYWKYIQLLLIGAFVSLIMALYLITDWGPFSQLELLRVFESERVIHGYRIFLGFLLIAILLLFFLQTPLRRFLIKIENWYFETANKFTHKKLTFSNFWLSCFYLLSFICLGIWIIVILSKSPQQYVRLVIEDGPIEYLSALFWFIAMSIEIYMAIVNRSRSKMRTVFYGVLALLFFVCGMEEISWGQRIIGFETPDLMIALNRQNEFNLHNIGSISPQQNVFFLFTAVFFVGIPLTRKLSPAFSAFLHNIHFPHTGAELIYLWIIAHTIWIIVGIMLGNLGFSPLTWKGFFPNLDDEIIEMYWALLFLSYATLDISCKKKKLP